MSKVKNKLSKYLLCNTWEIICKPSRRLGFHLSKCWCKGEILTLRILVILVINFSVQITEQIIDTKWLIHLVDYMMGIWKKQTFVKGFLNMSFSSYFFRQLLLETIIFFHYLKNLSVSRDFDTNLQYLGNVVHLDHYKIQITLYMIQYLGVISKLLPPLLIS